MWFLDMAVYLYSGTPGSGKSLHSAIDIIGWFKKGLPVITNFDVDLSPYCWLSYEPENDIARHLYRSFGFMETGDMDGEEIIAVLKL